MVFPVVGGNESKGYEVENSLRLNNDDSAKLGITFGSGGNRKTYTISFWVKRGHITAQQNIFGTPSEGDTLYFDGGDRLRFFQNGSASSYLGTNRLFRDPSAWYHIVVAVDTNQGTSTNRVKLYINGSQYTWDASTTYPAEDYEGDFNHTADEHMIGNGHHGNSFDGYISEFYFIDGTQYAASNFGETNDNGVWIPKAFTGTFGSNGFLCEFKQTGTSANASGIGADTSGNGNHLTPTNLAATDVTVDTPTNNFATLNPLDTNSNHTFSEGNCKIAYSASAGNFGATKATMGFASGKWYWEVKYTYGNAGQFGVFDINDTDTTNTTDIFTAAGNSTFEGLAWRIDTSNNIKEVGEGQQADTNVDFSSGNILGIAFDADNGKIYAYNNGTELTSQNIGAGTSLITAVTVSDFFLPFISNGDGGSGTKTGTSEINFGNPSFSISSGNSDANGYGNFEYSVPSGYYSLCTKNLAEYG